MSSLAVRQVVWDHLTANWATTPWYDLSDYVDYDDIPTPESAPYLLVEFVGGEDTLVTTAGTGGEDGYREDGIFYFHYVHPTGFSSRTALVQMESLRDLFKNTRFGKVVMENVNPFTDMDNASIQVDGPNHGWSSVVGYYTDTYSS